MVVTSLMNLTVLLSRKLKLCIAFLCGICDRVIIHRQREIFMTTCKDNQKWINKLLGKKKNQNLTNILTAETSHWGNPYRADSRAWEWHSGVNPFVVVLLLYFLLQSDLQSVLVEWPTTLLLWAGFTMSPLKGI